MTIGDRVSTPDGEGVIVVMEIYSRQGNRYGVKLDNPPRIGVMDDGILFYWEKEIKKE